MSEALQVLAEATHLFGLIVAVLLIGIYVSKRFRGRRDDDVSRTSDMITTFGDLHGRGHLGDDEYRTIKTMLEDESRRESRDNERTG